MPECNISSHEWRYGIASAWFANIHNRNAHGENAPESVRYLSDNGVEIWRNIDEEIHRLDGPAVTWLMTNKVEYWVHNLRHRTDGSAIINPDGSMEYWLMNARYPDKETWQTVVDVLWPDGGNHLLR